MIKRTYGNEKTALTLTAKAQKLYDGSDPFKIYEYDDDGILSYSFAAWGDKETDRMTAAELNRNLETLADGMED